MNNIILIGMMGAGKSSVAKRLSEVCNMEWIDTDVLIETMTGLDIPTIFQRFGELYFRDLETKILKSLKAHKGKVISVGGGMVLREENQRILSDLGETIYLKASYKTLESRLIGDQMRPLLKVESLEKILKDRESLYKTLADYIIETDGLSLDEVVSCLEKRCR